MKHVTCQEVAPLLPATAAGALDSDDAQQVNAHLALCPPCLKHLHEFQDAVEQLAFAVPQVAPSSALRARVLLAVAITPQAPSPEGLPGPGAGRTAQAAGRPAHSRHRLRALYLHMAPAALAACLLLLLASGVWMGVMAQQLEFMHRSLGDTQALHDLLDRPEAQVAPLKSLPAAGTATGQLIVAPGRPQLAVIATHLPPSGGPHGYEILMLAHGDHPPMHAGWLQADSAGVMMHVVDLPPDAAQMAGVRITAASLLSVSTPGSADITLLEGWYR